MANLHQFVPEACWSLAMPRVAPPVVRSALKWPRGSPPRRGRGPAWSLREAYRVRERAGDV